MIDQSLIINHPEKLIKSKMEDESGAFFGTLFDTHDPNMVLKQGHSLRDGWMLWAMFSIIHQYDWMPKIHILKINIDYKKKSCEYSALMERLKHPEGIYDNEDIAANYKINDERKIEIRYGNEERPYKLSDNTLLGMQEVQEEMEDWMSSSVRFDLHVYNWMLRGDQDVIIDPWASIQSNVQHRQRGLMDYLAKENPEKIRLKITH